MYHHQWCLRNWANTGTELERKDDLFLFYIFNSIQFPHPIQNNVLITKSHHGKEITEMLILRMAGHYRKYRYTNSKNGRLLLGLGEVLCVTDTVQILSNVGRETNRAHRSFCTPVKRLKKRLELHLQEILISYTYSSFATRFVQLTFQNLCLCIP